jgi:hypothetical protein
MHSIKNHKNLALNTSRHRSGGRDGRTEGRTGGGGGVSRRVPSTPRRRRRRRRRRRGALLLIPLEKSDVYAVPPVALPCVLREPQGAGRKGMGPRRHHGTDDDETCRFGGGVRMPSRFRWLRLCGPSFFVTMTHCLCPGRGRAQRRMGFQCAAREGPDAAMRQTADVGCRLSSALQCDRVHSFYGSLAGPTCCCGACERSNTPTAAGGARDGFVS